jgi:MFS family permease
MSKLRDSDFYGWAVAGLLSCCYAVAFIDRAIVNVASSPIKHDLGLSDTQFGLLSGTAFSLVYAFSGLPLGWLADRLDRRAMIALAILFWSAMTIVCGLTNSFGIFFAARMAVGLGEAALLPAGVSLLGAVMPPGRTARSIGIFLMGSSIGNAVALLGGGYLLTQLGQSGPIIVPALGTLAAWQVLFLLTCPLGLAAAVAVMTIHEPERAVVASTGPSNLRAVLRHVADHPSAYGFLAAATCFTVLLAQTQAVWMPLYYVRHFGLQPGASAVVIGWMFVAAVPSGQFTGGLLTDRLRALNVPGAPNAVIALCVTLALPAAVVFCTTDSLWLSEIAYTLFSFLVSASTPMGLVGLQLLTPKKHHGIASAVLASIAAIVGVGIGPVAVGLLSDHVFSGPNGLGLALLTVILAAGVAAPLFALGGRAAFARSLQALDPPTFRGI